ncbi:transketolase [Nocardiopsis valliformis]|uniref:transketolase n=1 Tax=Nocardiopsis valliformis TaxID=239974 RepID=UPI000345F08B|nr:transketolase [Nocardiopsis valliformis]
MGTDVRAVAQQMREDIVTMAGGPQGAHVGGSMSCVEILAVLHCEILTEGDTFVLSKGHAAPALYAVLAATGRIEREELATYAQPGSRLFGHPCQGLPGVPFPTGSLGHGLSLSVGMALAGELGETPDRHYTLLGDGELQEGSVWEAVMYAGHRRPRNLVAIVDRNALQLTGTTEDLVSLEPLAERFGAFGWTVRAVDGHDPDALAEVLRKPDDRPVAVIATTVKGRGIPFMEGRVSSHYATLKPALVKRAHTALRSGGQR